MHDAVQTQGIAFFLTYPHCDIMPDSALPMFKTKLPKLFEWVICRELHMDGSPHLHVYAKVEKRLRTSDPRFFDLENEEGKKFHGKYEVVRSPKE